LRAALSALGVSECVGLMPDYGAIERLEADLRGVASRRPINADLRVAADDLRRPFVELTALFGRKYGSLAWWASGIAERNTNGSDLFLHCCYLLLAQRYLDEGKSLGIVCSAPALRRLIVELARARGYRVCQIGRRVPRLRETVLWPIAALVWKTVYVLLRWLAVRLVRGRVVRHRRGAINPDVLLSTRVDRACLDGSGSLRDRYLPGLGQFYASRGLSSATVFAILEDLRVFWSMIRHVPKTADCILLEDHLRFADLAFPARMWARQRAFRFQGAILRGLDVSRLFDAANRTESLSVIATLHYPLMRRLAADGIHPRLVVLPFENMVFDKLTILGVHRFMPGTEVYGFCHNPLKRNVLPWYTDVRERDIAPLPDRVVCNGPRYREILLREGYAPERVVIGAALRYAYLHRGGAQAQGSGPRPDGAPPSILLVLTTKRDGTSEVIDKFVSAVGALPDAVVLVKPHPFARELAGGVLSALGGRARVVDGTMEEVLAASDIVVCAASGAILEAVLAGKRVIRVSPESQLDMDPLAWFAEFDPPVSTPEELARRLQEACAAVGTPSRARPGDALSSFFAPPTEEHMAAFLPTTRVGGARS